MHGVRQCEIKRYGKDRNLLPFGPGITSEVRNVDSKRREISQGAIEGTKPRPCESSTAEGPLLMKDLTAARRGKGPYQHGQECRGHSQGLSYEEPSKSLRGDEKEG